MGLATVTHEIIFLDRKRKQKAPEPVEISQLHRVKVIKILGVTITNGLSVSPHVQSIIASCAQVLYALRVLRVHGLCDGALHTIYRSDVVAKLLYASVPGRVSPTLQIGTKFNRSSARVKEMDTVHPIYLIYVVTINKLQGTLVTYLRHGVTFNNQLLSLPVKFLIGEYVAQLRANRRTVSCTFFAY